jgi:hypothetical protein
MPGGDMCRAMLRAVTVSIVAPQMPVGNGSPLPATRRHGPMSQIEQHAPDSPMGHGAIFITRVNALVYPSSSARFKTCSAAGSTVRIFGKDSFAMI